jgi:hypothetical protein
MPEAQVDTSSQKIMLDGMGTSEDCPYNMMGSNKGICIIVIIFCNLLVACIWKNFLTKIVGIMCIHWNVTLRPCPMMAMGIAIQWS